VDDQSILADFVSSSNSQSELYECEICGDSFDSSKGRGVHRAHSHSEEEIKEVLIEELQNLANELGETPSQRDMTRQGPYSVKTYQKKFGSWNGALEKADLEVNKEQSIAKSELLDELTRLSAELERTPTSRDVAEKGQYAPSNYTKKFESWNCAVREAGLEITRQRDISKDDLLAELKRLADELGHTPTVGEMRQRGKFGVRTYSKEFGSWNDTLREANLEINRRQDVDESELLGEISRLHNEFGRPPSVDIMNSDGDFAVSTYGRVFGSWNNALREAGFEVNNRSNIPELELLNALQRLGDEIGRTPTAADMEQEGQFGWATYETAFGSWNTALREAGFEPNVRGDVPETELRGELQRLKDELGHVPGRREMDDEGSFDSTTYMATFGTWNDALREADLTPNERRDIPKSDLLAELRRLADVLDRTPIRDEMESQGEFSHSVYTHRFGSWNDALIEAGLDPNKIIDPAHLDHIVRSTWELEVADLLLDLDVSYEYESLEIEYGRGRIYTPDFVTDQYIIEVKGAIYTNEKEKAEAAKSKLNDREYVVIGQEIPADIHIPWERRETVARLFA